MQNSDKGLPRISLAGCGYMLITLDTMVYFNQICIPIQFYIV